MRVARRRVAERGLQLVEALVEEVDVAEAFEVQDDFVNRVQGNS